MSKTLTSLWTEYMEKAERECHGGGQNIAMKFMERDILSDLATKGFEVPARRTLREALTSQLELSLLGIGGTIMLQVAPMDTS